MSAGKRKGIRLEEVSNPTRHGEPGGSHAADQRQRRHRLLERTVLNAAPEFLEPGHPVRCIVAGYEARVDGTDRGADHPVRLDAGFMQSLVDANLVGTERAATLQHQHDLAETGRQRDAVGVCPGGCGFVEREGPCACHRMSPVGDAVARTSFTLRRQRGTRRDRHRKRQAPGQRRRTLPRPHHRAFGTRPKSLERLTSGTAFVGLGVKFCCLCHVSAPSSRHRPAGRHR